ncbi:hypothetical protein K2173_015378 [Erythroxylum novogranatense]|uniref:Uncharacterized protein n=1 Tax=Erythroxylum novogranatense TaxID=1862640 RepID=A0AAV8SRH2_9ROSI|nr:hypothetical protein K2173_015378 [Erythroxylum novogranatense]
MDEALTNNAGTFAQVLQADELNHCVFVEDQVRLDFITQEKVARLEHVLGEIPEDDAIRFSVCLDQLETSLQGMEQWMVTMSAEANRRIEVMEDALALVGNNSTQGGNRGNWTS